IFILFLIFSTVINVSADETAAFKDVNKSNSHHKAIMHLTQEDIIRGYSDGTFMPYQTITRSQTAQLFTKAKSLPIPENINEILENYKDVNSSHTYANAIAATYKADIFTGNNGYFMDNQPLTRQQMATVLVKAFDLKNND